jgi:large repetitive protein
VQNPNAMKWIFIPFFILLLSINSIAQVNCIWVDNDPDEGPGSFPTEPTMAISGIEKSSGVVKDNDGNVYVVGQYQKKLNSGEERREAVYIYKYSPNGELLWEADIHVSTPNSSPNNTHDITVASGNSIAIGSDGIYVLAKANTTGGSGARDITFTSTSSPEVDNAVTRCSGIIAKYSFGGALLNRAFIRYDINNCGGSCQAIGWSSRTVNPVDITVDDVGSVYITGDLKGEILVGSANANPATSYKLRSNRCGTGIDTLYTDVFVVKLTNTLAYDDMRGIDFKNNATASAIDSDGNRVFIVGNYATTNNEIRGINSPNYGYSSLSASTCTMAEIPLDTCRNGGFMIKMDLSLGHLWSKKLIAPGTSCGDIFLRDVAVSGTNIYTLADVNDKVDLYFGFSGVLRTLQEGSRFALLTKVNDNTNPNFTVSWAQVIALTNETPVIVDPGNTLFADNNQVYVIGYSTSSTPQSIETYPTAITQSSTTTRDVESSHTTIGGGDILLGKYNSSGSKIWTAIIGGSGNERARGIYADSRFFYLAGQASLSPDMDPSPAVKILSTSGNINLPPPPPPIRITGGLFGGFFDFFIPSFLFPLISFSPASDGFVGKYGCFPIEILSERDTFCEGELTELYAYNTCEGCIYSYEWNNIVEGTSIVTTDNEYFFAGAIGTNSIILRATELNTGCVVSDTFTLVVNPYVSVSVSPANVTVCPGDVVSFVATSSPSAGAIYSWYKFGESTILGSNAAFSAVNPGAYTVVANVNGCKASFNANLDNYTPYSPKIVPDSAVICGAGGAFLQVLDCPGCSYSWTVPPASSALSTSNTIIADVTGNYQVNLVDPFGCQQTILRNVGSGSFLSVPIVPLNSNNQNISALCDGSPIVLSTIPYGTGTGQCATCSYQWSDGTTGPYTFAFSPGLYSVTVTDILSGCVGTSNTLNIQNSTFPNPTIDVNPYNICTRIPGSTISDPAKANVFNPCTGCNYQWQNNIGGTFGILAPTDSTLIRITEPGDYYVEMTDTFGCVSTSSIVTITRDTVSQPPISATGTELCGTNSVTLNTINCSGCSYQWYDGATALIPGATNFQYTASTNGIYNVRVSFDNSCVRTSTSITVTDVPTFNPQIGPNNPFLCNGEPVFLYLDPPSGFSVNSTYQWFYNGSPIIGESGHIHKAENAGLYYLQVTNGGGCTMNTNVVNVQLAIEGANPNITTSSPYICQTLPIDSVELTVLNNSCSNCTYDWIYGNAGAPNAFNTTTYQAYESGGYYVIVLDNSSGCFYVTSVFEVRDTQYIAPSISTVNNICSTDPVILSTTACPGCSYEWQWQPSGTATTFTSLGLSAQNTFSATATGNYRVAVTDAGSCPTPNSNSVPVTVLPFNAQLSLFGSSNICNGNSSFILAQPNRSVCPDCKYYWYRNGVAVVVSDITDTLEITQGGDYYAIVRQTYPAFSTTPYTFGCEDVSDTLSFSDVSVSVNLSSSALAICGPSGQVSLTVDSCQGCSYAWFFDGDTIIGGLNYIPLTGSNDTFFIVNGAAAKGMYKVRVTKNGCQVFDSLYLPDVPAPVYSLDTSSAPFANICGGTPITLTSSCITCYPPVSYQWYQNAAIIPGAVGASHLAISGGDYQLIAADVIGCVTALPMTTVIEVNPPAGFALVLDPVSVVPLTTADFNLDPYLSPASLHSVNAYSSVPQPAAIVSGDMFSPAAAGTGPHLVAYTYNLQNCSFVTRDTIEVLSPMAVDVVNLNPIAPAYEACITDNLQFILTNYTFEPNQILFPTSSTTFDTLTISSAGLTQFAGVWSGNINVTVPPGAVTGKVKFRNSVSGDQFQSPFFLVVQNPAVALGLNGVPQPLCSNADTIALTGFPSPGTFAAAYSDSTNVLIASLISGNNFLVENVADYDPLTGYRFLKLTYTYIPSYTNNLGFCPPVVDSLNVQVNNVELDSIEYTPISQTQANMPLADLTRLIWPLENRNYPGAYVGTYVTGNNIQANTLPFPSPAPASVSDTVIYTFNNGICFNSLANEVDVWRRPVILDSIPLWVCQSDDTIFIGRNSFGLFVRRNGTTYTMDANYVYVNNSNISNTVDFAYSEQINIMNIVSSNGGLLPLALGAGSEEYALVPALVSGSSTDITLSFSYNRTLDYFTPLPEPTITTNYIIAEVSKRVNIEVPIAAQINPAILADPIFCQDNSTQQFSGIPNGGQHFVNGVALAGNLFNPNAQALIHGDGAQTLTYVFVGNACVDSASTTIVIPAQFTVAIAAPNGPDYCQLDAPDTISVFTVDPGLLDPAAAVFLVNTVISGQIFNPAVAPALLDTNIVVYIAQDTFGCTSNDTAIFVVNPMPSIRMTNFDQTYCLNAPAFNLDLFEDTLHSTNWHLQSNGYSDPAFPNILVTLIGNGVVPPGNNPAAPVYSPMTAGVGMDTVYYTYTNTLTGCATTINRITRIKPLPALTLTTTGGALLNPAYCERDTVPIFATPAGGTFLSLSTTNPGGSNFVTTIPAVFHANIPGILPATATEIIGYEYMDPVTLCTDTIRDTILIQNFTTDAVINGLPADVCADDTIYVLSPGFGAGPAVSGTFGSLWAIDSTMISSPAVNVGNFNPYLSGIFDTGRDVYITYTYQDAVNAACINTVYDTVTLKPLPQLSFIMPGDSLFNSSDPRFHICFSAPVFSMQAFNRYNGISTALQTNEGTYFTNSGLGIVYSSIGTGNWNYVAPQALPGLDSINFTYTFTPTGCTNTHSEPIVVDTVPELGFAGFDPFKLDTVTNHFVYCSNDMPHLVIPSPFGGFTYWNHNPIPSILFELRPDTLVVGGVTTIHRLTYEFISARYQNGGVCLDSTVQFVEVRPTPILTLSANVPDFYCVADSVERLVLSALPSGGIFEDISLGVIAGIVGDSLFNPMAQMGRRNIIYHYTDTISGCTDTLSHTISVYNLPEVSFETGGGCQGDTVLFLPNPAGLSNTFPAIDSITLAVWNYGDGVVDTITTFTNQILVPNRTHIYTATGVYYPSLTIINRGTCDTSFTRRIVVSPKFVVNDTTPYLQDFQLGPANWFQENGDPNIAVPADSLWEWGIAVGQRLTTIQESNFAWVTNLDGSYNQGDNAWVLSPCFDISALNRPMVALDIWRDSREGVDGVIMQFFDRQTQNWRTLGVRNKGIKWYNPPYVISAPGYQVGAPIGWSGSSNGWEDARYRLDVSGGDLRGFRNLRFRLAFASSPNSVVGNLEGFAFDNFYIGNRTRSVLVEHFTNQNFANMAQVETDLYSMIYSNLYGRDVNLIQYHTEYNTYDYLHQQSIAESNSRVLFYGINNSDQVRINGLNLLDHTSSLVNWGSEVLDMQMLQDAKFKIKLYPVTIQQGNMTITADVTALEDVLYDDYALQVVVTEDSIQGVQGHNMMSIARTMRPDASGTTLPSTWVAADMVQNAMTWDFGSVTGVNYNPNNLRVVVFVQNRNTGEVYQVATSRNLNIFNGPVTVEDIEMQDGKEILDMNLYPNPAQNYFNVEFTSELLGEYDWKLVDVTGRVLRNGKAEAGTNIIQVNTEYFSPGMYIFSINNNTVYAQRKVIIAK